MSSVFQELTVGSILIWVWIAVMILVPVIRWTAGIGAERVGIAAGVFAQVAAVVAALVGSLGVWTLVVVLLVPAIGWASEVVGSRTGIPFGAYHYTDVLQPQLARVPILIPLAWLMMMPPAWAVGVLIAPRTLIVQWLVAAGAFAAWDVYLDPMMVRWGFWEWRRKGRYEGIPFVNFIGWFAVAFLITALVSLIGWAIGVPLVAGVPVAPLVLVFVVTWLLMFVGQLLFWRMRVSAVAGFVAMGVFVAVMVGIVGL